MPSDTTRRRLTIADIGRKPLVDLTKPEAPRSAPRPPVRPAAPKPPPRPVKAATPPPRPAPKPPVAAPPPPTPAVTAKAQRQGEVLAVLTALGQRFPAVFGANCIPLAIGIRTAIQVETGIEPRLLSAAMRRWCSRDRYIAAVAKGTHRHGLDGAPVTELTDEERTAAAVQLAGLRAAMRRKP
jgi:hypothetical protein